MRWAKKIKGHRRRGKTVGSVIIQWVKIGHKGDRIQSAYISLIAILKDNIYFFTWICLVIFHIESNP